MIVTVEGDTSQTVKVQLVDGSNRPMVLAGHDVSFIAGSMEVACLVLGAGWVSFEPDGTLDPGVYRSSFTVNWNGSPQAFPDGGTQFQVLANTRAHTPQGDPQEIVDLIGWAGLWFPGWENWDPPPDGEFLVVDPETLAGEFPDASGNDQDAAFAFADLGGIFLTPPVYDATAVNGHPGLTGGFAVFGDAFKAGTMSRTFDGFNSVVMIGRFDNTTLAAGAGSSPAGLGSVADAWSFEFTGGTAGTDNHLFVGTVDGDGNGVLYVDNVEVASGTTSTGAEVAFPQIIFGEYMTTASVAGWATHVLTTDERAALHAHSQAVYGTP